jgi:SAM-dependent methyltransferase
MTSPSEPSPTSTGIFDTHLASHYDQTRALGEAAMAALTRTLQAELSARGTCLEIGVGTGRIALPLAGAGVPVVGIDPSVPMLARLRAKTPSDTPLRVLRADATALPFADGSFGAGLICHVLHLIRRWEDALRELVRVVRRPGVILIEHAERGGQAGDLRRHFHEAAGVAPYGRLGVRDPEQVDAALVSLGARGRPLPTVADERTTTVGEIIDRLEMGIHSSNANLPEDVRRRAATATRHWAATRYGSLDAPLHFRRSVTWRAYEL